MEKNLCKNYGLDVLSSLGMYAVSSIVEFTDNSAIFDKFFTNQRKIF